MEPEQKPLLERIRSLNERPKNLSFDDIVSRVADFMKDTEKLRMPFSFSNEVGESLEDDNDARFDPIAAYEADPDQLDDIVMYVEHDMNSIEPELLSRKDSSLYAYNTLVFGAAIRLHREEALSRELSEFLVEHLIAPKPPKKEMKRGRPKATNDDGLFRFQAIKFAAEHGLHPTRNDVTEDQKSACDAVCNAALRLYQIDKKPDYATGYSYESLKKLWHKEK